MNSSMLELCDMMRFESWLCLSFQMKSMLIVRKFVDVTIEGWDLRSIIVWRNVLWWGGVFNKAICIKREEVFIFTCSFSPWVFCVVNELSHSYDNWLSFNIVRLRLLNNRSVSLKWATPSWWALECSEPDWLRYF